MEGFVRRENIRRYRKLLREVEDEPGRRLIRKLLLEEEQKEVPLQMPSLPTARRRFARPSRMLSAHWSSPCAWSFLWSSCSCEMSGPR